MEILEVGHGQALGSEDDQVKRAMAMSMSDSHTFTNQESEIVGNQAFGPATRTHYDSDKWALTVPGPQTQEILLNPEPADRKRRSGAPAFFKPSPTGHRLPALLKILHAIPMAREALLNRTYTLPDYGYEKDWWDGAAIKFLRIVNLDLDGRQVDSDDIIHETQRLIAFLDQTERAYGSIDVLARLDVIENGSHDKIDGFLKGWRDVTAQFVPNAPLLDTFMSTGTKVSTDNTQSEHFCCLNIRLDDEISGKGLTLYEALDHVLWSDNRDGEETFLENVGNVFTIHISNLVSGNAGLGIKIPANWYADRYLRSSTKQMMEMMSRKAQVLAELDSKEKAQVSMMNYTSSRTGATCDTRHLFSTAMSYFETTEAYRSGTPIPSDFMNRYKDTKAELPSPARIAQDLKALSDRISDKFKGMHLSLAQAIFTDLGHPAFDDVRENTRQELKEISQMYTKPSNNPEESPHCMYTLRGVSTTSHTAYVLEMTRSNDEDNDLRIKSLDWQWWKIEYMANDTQPVVCKKVTESDVLTAASTESADALLLYASNAAISYKNEDLPTQLHNFVRADNLDFSAELGGSDFSQPATPIKRRMEDDNTDAFGGYRQRSSAHDRTLVDTTMSLEDPYPNPSRRMSHLRPRPPQAFSYHQSNPRQNGLVGSSDEEIPTSLQGKQIVRDRSSSLQHPDDLNEGQEMQGRGAGQSPLPAREGDSAQYILESYMPQIGGQAGEEETRMEEDPRWTEGRGG